MWCCWRCACVVVGVVGGVGVDGVAVVGGAVVVVAVGGVAVSVSAGVGVGVGVGVFALLSPLVKKKSCFRGRFRRHCLDSQQESRF